MMVPTCSENTLSGTMAFRYIHGPGLMLSTLARAKIRYPEFTPIDHVARREISHHPQLKILQTWKLRRHRCRCCRAFEPANLDVATGPVCVPTMPAHADFPHIRIRTVEAGPLKLLRMNRETACMLAQS